MSGSPDRIMFWDLETENNPYCGAIASPRHPDNYVVLNGWAIDKTPMDGPIEHLRNNSKEEAASRPWITIPDDVWLIVMHNAPFEMDWLLVQQRPEITKFLKRGGRVFCTAYAHYLLSNQLDTYPSLDEIAPLYGGAHKVDGIKILWEQGHKTSEIDPALLLEYLISPTNGDVANTRQIFYQQVAQLQSRGMWTMALERMEGMLFCCYAMDAGLFVDQKVAWAALAVGEARIAELKAMFETFRSGLPPEVEFKESSDYHMSAWLFGGPIKYRKRVPAFEADGTTPKWEKGDFVKSGEQLVPVDEQGCITAQVNADVLTLKPELMEFETSWTFERYKSGKNKGQVKVFREDTAVQKLVWAEALYFCPPLVDLNLLGPAVKREFEKEFQGKRTLADDSPVISTGKDCLEKLQVQQALPAEVREVLARLDEYAKLDKDMGTYYLREVKDDEGNVTKQSGMLKFLTDLSIVHHVLNCTSTVTTRLSSNRPNFQNLPRGDTSNVKQMFTSRYDNKQWLDWARKVGLIDVDFYVECCANLINDVSNGYIVEADYSALEVVTLAAFSKDKALTKALTDGIDMHTMRLSAKIGRPYAELMVILKDENHPEHSDIKNQRTNIKPRAFAYQYGATARGIAFATGCSVEEAEAFIATEKALFPEVETFYDEQITPVVAASSVLHREQRDDNSWRVYKRGVWQSPGGTCYSFREYEKATYVNGKRTEGMEYKPTQIRNYPIQGESGFFVQGICGLVIRWLIANDFFGGRVTVINTVHDAIYLDCHRSVLDTVAAGVKAIMESLPVYFSTKYGYTLDVPFPAAVEFGTSMFIKQHWHPGVLEESNGTT